MIKIIFKLFGVALNGDCTLYDRHIWLKKNLILLNEKSNLLDVGCGYGGMLLPFAQEGSKTVGVDPDKDSINYGKKGNKLSKLINGSFGSSTGVSLGSMTFNFLFLYSLITFLKSNLG